MENGVDSPSKDIMGFETVHFGKQPGIFLDCMTNHIIKITHAVDFVVSKLTHLSLFGGGERAND